MLPIHPSSSAFVLQAPAAGLSETDRALAQAFSTVSEGLVDLDANDIGETVKLIFGRDHDAQRVPRRFVDALASRPLPGADRDSVSLPQLRILTALYIALWRGNAFQANGVVDFDGIVAFVSHYLEESNDWAATCLGSGLGTCHFGAIKRFGPAVEALDAPPMLSVCDSVGGEIPVPEPIARLLSSGGRYHGLYLAKLNLRGCDLADVHFTASNFTAANLSFVTFDDVKLHRCCIDATIFEQARLIAVDIDTSHAKRALFTHAMIRGGRWVNSQFDGTNFHCTEIEALDIMTCSFNGARFTGPRRPSDRPGPTLFRDVVFQDSILDAAVFSSLVAAGMILDRSTCRRATFIDNQFTTLRLTATADGALFKRNYFWASSFSAMEAKGSIWSDASFDDDCAFVGADFSDSTLHRVTFKGPAFEGINFRRASLRDVKFSRAREPASFTAAIFNDATIESVIFRRCDFRQSTFEAARLAGSQFVECDLRGVNLSAATGLDVVSAEGVNNLTGACLLGTRGGLADWALDGLALRGRRDRMLNRHRHANCMMASIMRVADLSIRVDWVLAIASFLERRALGATDADASMLDAMLALAEHPEAATLATRGHLERYIYAYLIRQVPELNDSGLSSAPEAIWTIQAAGRIGGLLIGLSNVAAWRRMGPLIASIIALHDQAIILLDAQTLAGLRHARQVSLPDGLAASAQAAFGFPMFAQVHPCFLTPDADRALFVVPEVVCDFLGITHHPVDIATSCFVFRETPDGWERVMDSDNHSNNDSNDETNNVGAVLIDTIRRFPLFARSLGVEAVDLEE